MEDIGNTWLNMSGLPFEEAIKDQKVPADNKVMVQLKDVKHLGKKRVVKVWKHIMCLKRW